MELPPMRPRFCTRVVGAACPSVGGYVLCPTYLSGEPGNMADGLQLISTRKSLDPKKAMPKPGGEVHSWGAVDPVSEVLKELQHFFEDASKAPVMRNTATSAAWRRFGALGSALPHPLEWTTSGTSGSAALTRCRFVHQSPAVSSCFHTPEDKSTIVSSLAGPIFSLSELHDTLPGQSKYIIVALPCACTEEWRGEFSQILVCLPHPCA
ncbi:hypothetical protein VTO42DRAFT_217 [Malbranchea cinnamomea]